MKKNVYSLVLSEGVVNAVDALAYREGTNRSALINRILAEYLSYTTPEMRMRDIFKSIDSLLSGSAFRLAEPSDTILSLRSSLAYKYNPTVRYSVELYRDSEDLGALRVSLRTQNTSLLLTAMRFYTVFAAVEEKYIGKVRFQIEDGKFLRVFSLRVSRVGVESLLSTDDVGELIARYVEMLDSALKTYFAHADNALLAAQSVDAVYRAFLAESKYII